MPELTPPIEERREAERRKYLTLSARSGGTRGYGGTNHGRHAYTTVIAWQPCSGEKHPIACRLSTAWKSGTRANAGTERFRNDTPECP